MAEDNMVAVDSHRKLTRLLELELLEQAEYKLPLVGYALVALMPVDPNSWVSSKTLLISATEIDKAIQQQLRSRWDITYDIQLLLKQGLQEEQYLEIYSIDILDSSAFVIQQINSYFPHIDDGEFEAPIQLIGGITGQNITIIRSSILSKLNYEKYYLIHLEDGRKIGGHLTDIQPLDGDAEFTFILDKSNTEPFSCRFTNIVSLDSR